MNRARFRFSRSRTLPLLAAILVNVPALAQPPSLAPSPPRVTHRVPPRALRKKLAARISFQAPISVRKTSALVDLDPKIVLSADAQIDPQILVYRGPEIDPGMVAPGDPPFGPTSTPTQPSPR